MKRNGLVFVPREPPKRVILYPTQESASQQPNGLNGRAKTAIVTNTHNETIQQPTSNNPRLSRQAPLSSPPNSISKTDNNGTVTNVTGQQLSLNFGQKIQNPYYANPFFRPKMVTNQQAATTTNTSSPPTPPSRDSSAVTTNVTIQTLTSSSTIPNRGRQPVYPHTQNPLLSSNGRTQDSETTVITSPTQDDSRRWAHSVASASIVRRTVSDERPNGITKPPEANVTNTTNTDLLKPKGASATDIVISLMDTWRAPLNTGGTSAVNVYNRNGGIRDDSAISGQTTTTTGEQVPSTPPFLSVGTSSTTSNNNQNWKKALVANFQKNSRNNPAAKLFNSKQTTVPLPGAMSLNNDPTMNQQQKNDRLIVFNGMNNEHTFQVNENTRTIPLIRKTTESLRVTKQDNTNNIERSTSLQIQASAYSNPLTANTANKTEEMMALAEVSNTENTTHLPIPIPSALITAKPPANVEQQRAIITRVMIRRDFVKSAEAKPPMPTATNFRSLIPPQSAKPGGLPQSNIIQVATITENNNATNTIVNSNRIYPQQQQLQTMPLSQKSLLSFTSLNPTVRESIKIENNQQQSSGTTNDGMISTSITKTHQPQIVTNNGLAFRSNSLSAANAESRRKKEEININKAKKRANSASALSTDG